MAQLEAWKYQKEKGQELWEDGCTASSWQRDAWSGRRRGAQYDSD